MIRSAAVLVLALASRVPGADSAARPVPVRYTEGITHGFLTLHALDGKHLADGDLFQTARGDQVTAKMVLRFEDGSLEEETTTFSQRGHFALLQYRLVQKGPSFPNPIDVTIDTSKASVTLRSIEGAVVSSERMEMPADLANGIVLYAIKNLAAGSGARLSMIAPAPKPRLVRLNIDVAGEDSYAIGGNSRKASRYVVKVDLRGIAGVVAPLIGKQPPDTSIWISQGDAPTFVKMEGPFFAEGPVWRLELAAPTWGAR